MGVRTDAYLAYGVDLGEHVPSWLRDMTGTTNVYDMERVLRDKFGLGLEIHCSDECSMWVLAVADSVVHARRGYPRVVNPTKNSQWDDKWNAVREHAGEPAWLLFSYWG